MEVAGGTKSQRTLGMTRTSLNSRVLCSVLSPYAQCAAKNGTLGLPDR